MRLSVGCSMDFNASIPTPAMFMLRPRSGYGQWVVQEEYRLSPYVPVVEYTDGYGNLCQRLVVPQGEFTLSVKACVETADQIDVNPTAAFISVPDLPETVLQYLLPSRYCESDKLYNQAAEIVSGLSPGYGQVEAIRRWICDQIEYQYGTSNASTSACDVLETRQGVCRDFAHLGIALCRSLNIPARMVVGYLYGLKPMDQHAWFEAFLGYRWYTFDATQRNPMGNRVATAYGRDAADVALVTQFGPLTLQDMKVWVEPAEVRNPSV